MEKQEFYLVLDNIRSRENVGSIFRIADAVGINKIYLCGITPIPPHQKISKTALGAENWVSWEYRSQTWRLLGDLKTKKKIKIIGLEKTKKSINIFDFKQKFPLALVLGNEVKGLSSKILKYCDEVIYIPMFGKKESLNVAVALGIAAYQLKIKK